MPSAKRKALRSPQDEVGCQVGSAKPVVILLGLSLVAVLCVLVTGSGRNGGENTARVRLAPGGGAETSEFASRFTSSAGVNNSRWRRDPRNPVIPRLGDGWRSVWTANPDVLLVADTYYMYYRGTGPYKGRQHDRLGVATVAKGDFKGYNWNDWLGNPLFDVGEGKSYDCNAILDPAVIYDGGTWFCYYSAINAPDWSVGLAISKDGFHFKKHGPVLEGRAPEIVKHEGIFYLFYVWHEQFEPGRWGYNIFLATSRDGLEFEKQGMVLSRAGSGWDSQTVTTPRVFKEGEFFNMVYAGDDDSWDEPNAFGLATSTDLRHWRKFPGNPIFTAGKPGSWDQGCLWFGTCERIDGKYYLWYEGSTGGYSQVGMAGLTSQIGLAILE